MPVDEREHIEESEVLFMTHHPARLKNLKHKNVAANDHKTKYAVAHRNIELQMLPLATRTFSEKTAQPI